MAVAMGIEFLNKLILVLHQVFVLAESNPEGYQVVGFVELWELFLNFFENCVKKELVF